MPAPQSETSVMDVSNFRIGYIRVVGNWINYANRLIKIYCQN